MLLRLFLIKVVGVTSVGHSAARKLFHSGVVVFVCSLVCFCCQLRLLLCPCCYVHDDVAVAFAIYGGVVGVVVVKMMFLSVFFVFGLVLFCWLF